MQAWRCLPWTAFVTATLPSAFLLPPPPSVLLHLSFFLSPAHQPINALPQRLAQLHHCWNLQTGSKDFHEKCHVSTLSKTIQGVFFAESGVDTGVSGAVALMLSMSLACCLLTTSCWVVDSPRRALASKKAKRTPGFVLCHFLVCLCTFPNQDRYRSA